MLGTTAVKRFSGSFYLLIAALFVPLPVHSESISTQVSCFTAGQAAVVDGTSCYVSGAEGYASDNLQLTVSKAASPSDFTTVVLSETGVAAGTLNGLNPGSSAVVSSAFLDYELKTVGPERPGYLEVSVISGLDTEWAIANLTYSIGQQSGGCYSHTLNCSFGSTPPVSSFLPDRYFEFTLGDPFSLQLAYSDTFYTAQDSSYSPVSGSFELQFRFFEADGVTPASLNPEPSTWGTIVVAIVLLGAGDLHRRRGFLNLFRRSR